MQFSSIYNSIYYRLLEFSCLMEYIFTVYMEVLNCIKSFYCIAIKLFSTDF